METIAPARLKPGVNLTDLPGEPAAAGEETRGARLVRGKALIIWDPASLPGTKYAK
jgi:hypothetical protein